MTTKEKTNKKFTDTITFKGMVIGVLVLILLVPQSMIRSLIHERSSRSTETIRQINEKWSGAQTITPPILTLPHSVRVIEHETVNDERRERISYRVDEVNIAPSRINIDVEIFPETRSYGIFNATLYRSEIRISGSFDNLDDFDNLNGNWGLAYITIGISDLKGLVSDAAFTINGITYQAESSSRTNWINESSLKIPLKNFEKPANQNNEFSTTITLNGSESINFIPVGKITQVNVSGKWDSPNFGGNFSPQSMIENGIFSANWHIMHFNRNIPERWSNSQRMDFSDSTFGVRLIETVNHYQQNERSAKYAIMFLALTFAVFFFVEIFTGKKIHPIQYLLVGLALILFYSLLLSFSERFGFEIAYLVASISTVGLITTYSYSIFKHKLQTAIMFLLLCILYTFLFVILRLEDTAFLIGSIGLFIILGVCMYISRKINWYKL
ncbi:MAG: cell envelope integrity protein CreD [Dysgonamonadaceae bacterium]|jgi:inner membrane protein|nr:cell envelope integrity protein CreD [Dysgonamonadaceae bacterium]